MKRVLSISGTAFAITVTVLQQTSTVPRFTGTSLTAFNLLFCAKIRYRPVHQYDTSFRQRYFPQIDSFQNGESNQREVPHLVPFEEAI